MTVFFRNSAATAAIAATLSMVATPTLAADLPVPSVADVPIGADAGWEAGDDIANRYRRHRYRRNRGVDAGDVIAGVLVLGTIAAVASASNRNRDARYRDRDYRTDRQTDRRSSPRSSDSSGLDRAVDICLREIERDVRVDEVNNVARTSAGWQVDGSLYDGQGFSCRIGNDGRIDGVDYGAQGRVSASGYAPVQDRQFSEETYAKAWQDVPAEGRSAQADVRYSDAEYTAPQTAQGTQEAPAYPGGPVGDDYYVAEGGR